MSESKEKTTAEVKKEKSDKKSADAVKKNKENVFKRMGKSIKRFFKDFRGECKKITWPTGKTVLNNSIVVLVVVAIVGLVIFGIDQGLALIIKQLVALSNSQDAKQAAEATTQMISMFFLK